MSVTTMELQAFENAFLGKNLNAIWKSHVCGFYSLPLRAFLSLVYRIPEGFLYFFLGQFLDFSLLLTIFVVNSYQLL